MVMTIGDKDLEKLIASIGKDEQANAQKQAEMDRLKQTIEKQKKEIQRLEQQIAQMKQQSESKYDLPPDIEELRRILGQQRADINAKDSLLEQTYARIAELEGEINNTKLQYEPLSRNLESYIGQVGELKAKLIEQDAVLKFKNNEIQEWQIKAQSVAEYAQKIEQNAAGSFNQITELRNEISQKDQQILSLQNALTNIQGDFEQVKSKLDRLESDSSSSGNQVYQLRTELNTKDGQISDLQNKLQEKTSEVELARQAFDKLKADSSNSIQQYYQLKTDVASKEAQIFELQSKLQHASSELEVTKQALENIKNETSASGSTLAQMKADIVAKDEKIGELERKLDGITKERDMFQAEVNKKGVDRSDFEKKAMDLELTIKEMKAKIEMGEKRETEWKDKYNELLARYDKYVAESAEYENTIKIKQKRIDELQEFKDNNVDAVLNLKNLMKLFETEPFFKMFNVVGAVGEVSVEDIKAALAVPQVTLQKYIQQFVKAGVFQIAESGKISLAYKKINLK
jgi:chromosome segregation ATPase